MQTAEWRQTLDCVENLPSDLQRHLSQLREFDLTQAVEALYSATFVKDYLDCEENLPSDLQQHLSRLREFDLI